GELRWLPHAPSLVRDCDAIHAPPHQINGRLNSIFSGSLLGLEGSFARSTRPSPYNEWHRGAPLLRARATQAHAQFTTEQHSEALTDGCHDLLSRNSQGPP